MSPRRWALRPKCAAGTPLSVVTGRHNWLLRTVCMWGDEAALHAGLGLLLLFFPLAILPWGSHGLVERCLSAWHTPDKWALRTMRTSARPMADLEDVPPRRRRMLQLLLGITGPAACPPSVLARWPAVAPLWRAARWGGSALRHGRGGMVRHRAATWQGKAA